METKFLYLCFGLLLTLLYVVFVVGMSLVYWTPLRGNPNLPFTISPIEWTVLFAYLIALAIAGGGAYYQRKGKLGRVWLALGSCATIFALSGWLAEYLLYFNAHEWEKEEGLGIIVGCYFLCLVYGCFFSIVWWIDGLTAKRKFKS